MPTLTVPVLIRSREPSLTYDNLFQPLQIGRCTVPNRIARTAHSTGTSGEALIAYHEERARGGVGLAILEIAGVLPTSATHIPVFTDAVVDFYQEIARRLHAHGTKVFQQLWHGGAAYGRAGQPISASDIPTPSVNVIPRPMTKTMIDDVVVAFVAAARRCRDGGLDGIELHGAHGYLIHQFLSPATNLRDDEYGGSTENRARFLIEILEAVRAEVGDFPLGVRLSGTDFIEGGVDPAEAARIAKLVEPLVDFVDVSMSSYWRFHKFLSTLDDPLGYEIETSEQVTRVVDVPTIVAGRIMTLDHASHLVQAGVADMVSIVRGMIADPQLVVKARTGREAEIRPCIGTSMGCVANLMTTGKLQCVVNVAAGNETTVPFETPAPAPSTKKVLVIGGGPAGLEAARTAALRGHDVELYEMAGFLGGQVRSRRAAPHRSDLEAITRFLADEVTRLGVKVHLRTPVDPDLVIDARPDEVILATGSTPRRDGFQLSSPSRPVPGATLPHVHTVWEVLGFGGRRHRWHDGGRLRRHGDVRGHLGCRRASGGWGRRHDREPPRAARCQHRLSTGDRRGQPRAALRRRRASSCRPWCCRRSRPPRSWPAGVGNDLVALVPRRHRGHRHLPPAQRRARPSTSGTPGSACTRPATSTAPTRSSPPSTRRRRSPASSDEEVLRS